MEYKKVIRMCAIPAAAFAAGAVVGIFLYRTPLAPANNAGMLFREQTSEYHFISPLLLCEISENKEFDEYSTLKQKVAAVINRHLEQGEVSGASVYFRELNSGRWFGINENEAFSPASLLKVTRAIAYYAVAGKSPEILDKSIIYRGTRDENQDEYFRSDRAITHGSTYTIRELIEYMLQYSDNNAVRLLDENLNVSALNEVYADLGVPSPIATHAGVDFMSAKTYSRFFRILYNATYVGRRYSEQILAMLAKIDFAEGLRAGVPKNISIADKFGERSVYLPNGVLQFRELHDCGIVYRTGNPYFICVMTKGNDFSNLKKLIGDVSGVIFVEGGGD